MAKLSKFTPLDTMSPDERKPYGLAKADMPPDRTEYPGRDGPLFLPTFEIALVLAGAVSAGAYTAGVLDYLVETLDAWEERKLADALAFGAEYQKWSVPPHSVRIKVIAGASAGSLCGALFAIATRSRFPHVSLDSPIAKPGDPPHPNLLYRAWVQMVDIRDMLKPDGLPADLLNIESLLDTDILDSIVKSSLDSAQSAPPGPPRPYLGAQVHYGFSVGNLVGIPYLYELSGMHDGLFATTRHADIVRFTVQSVIADTGSSGNPPDWTPDFARLLPASGIGSQRSRWQEFAGAALASSAFPVALKARVLEKPAAAYRFDLRMRLNTPEGGTLPMLESTGTRPDSDTWHTNVVAEAGMVSTMLEEESLRFATVDGGTMNNQPFEFARRVLAGPLGSSPREGPLAIRAIVLVEPFPASAPVERTEKQKQAEQDTRIISTVPRLLGAYIDQARYDSNDLTMATDPNIYSRFMLSPVRQRAGAAPDAPLATGADAIASGSLQAFGGFLDVRFRHHDFLLGRNNAEIFIRDYFSLPANNLLFNPAARPGDTPGNQPPNPWWDIAAHGTATEPNFAFWTLQKSGVIHERLLIPAIKAMGQPGNGEQPLEPQPLWPGNPATGQFAMGDITRLLDKWVERLIDLGVNAAIDSKIARWIVRMYVQKKKRPGIVKTLSGTILKAVEEDGLTRPDG